MKSRIIFLTGAIMAALLLFPGCASIVSKSKYPISINSEPSKAKISITNKKGTEIYQGHTPSIVLLKAGAGFFSKAEYWVKFSSPGYDEKIVPIRFTLDAWYFGNIIFGGLIGMLIVDPATGAMWKIDARYMNIHLSESPVTLSPELRIMDICDVPAELKDHLVRIK